VDCWLALEACHQTLRRFTAECGETAIKHTRDAERLDFLDQNGYDVNRTQIDDWMLAKELADIHEEYGE
jgi:hypothetical protein